MSNLSADQLRALFAKGILKHGKATKKNPRGKVIFDRKRDKEIKRMQGKGNAGSTYRQKGSTHVGANSSKNFAFRGNKHNHNTNAVKNSPSLSKSGAGLKAAHLRSGQGGKPKVDHSATRAARVSAGLERLAQSAGANATKKLNRIHETNQTFSRKPMPSKFPGTYKDTGERFPAGTKIYYGDGPEGKGAYRRRAGGKDYVPAINELKATTRKGALFIGTTRALSAAERERGGYERSVGGRKVVDRFPQLGPYEGKKRGVKAEFGRRIRNSIRAAMKEGGLKRWRG